MRPELVHHVFAMVADGVGGDAEHLGHLLLTEVFDDEGEDDVLGVGEGGEAFVRGLLGGFGDGG